MNLLSEIYAAVLPLLLSLLAAWLAKVMAGAADEAKRRWGIEIEARHREALHSALMSGIRAALNRGLTGPAAIDSAVKYATQSVPDALARLAYSNAVAPLPTMGYDRGLRSGIRRADWRRYSLIDGRPLMIFANIQSIAATEV